MWKKPEYSKSEINRAGKTMIDSSASQEDRIRSLEIIDNWRAAHAYPMNVFAVNLKRQVSDIEGAVVVRRLKRLDTICKKLERNETMQLYRMQDLGGCRVIVPTIEDVYKVKERLEKSRIRHESKTPKDYIKTPNPNTGYRSVHMIYKYKSDKVTDYNGLLVEIQIRTKLQHLWATAVETVGLFTGNGLKFNQGSAKWLEYFRMISALFAIEEGTNIVEGAPTDIIELIERLISLQEELDAISKMGTIGLFVKKIGHVANAHYNGYYLLKLDLDEEELSVRGYEGVEKGLVDATEAYNEIERTKGDRSIDVVLVAAQSYESLVDAYPNYFANVKEFIDTVLGLMVKYIDLIRKESIERELVEV